MKTYQKQKSTNTISRFLFSLLVCFVAVATMQAQQREIKGIVTSESNNEPLIGVSIVVKDLKGVGTTSDIDGSYSISVAEGSTLVFSYLGFSAQEIKVGNQTTINVVMTENRQLLEEVVVTGMAISRKKKTLGYSTQEVKSEELMRVRPASVSSALVGKVSGMRFLTPPGSSFGDASTVMRGTNSLDMKKVRGLSPIYVIDGLISEDQSAVNMDDVESVNVLKGPAATALYGSRGGNGAIIITTKSGKKDYQEVSVTHTTTFDTYYQHAKYQSEYGGGALGASDGKNATLKQYKYTAGPNVNPAYAKLDGAYYYDMDAADQSWGPRFNKDIMYAPWYAWDPTDPRFGKLIPWTSAKDNVVKDGLRTGVTNTTNISFAKGGEDYLTRISFSNSSRDGLVANSGMEKRYFSMKSSFNVFKRLKISADYKYSYRKAHNTGSNSFFTGYATGAPRDLSIKELKNYRRADGSINSYIIKDPAQVGDYSTTYNNPFASIHEINNNTTTNRHLVRGTAEFIINPKMSVAFIYNGDIYNYIAKNKTPRGFNNSDAYFGESQSTYTDTQLQGQFIYKDAALDNRLRWDANVFIEQRDYHSETLTAASSGGLLADNHFNLSSSFQKPSASNSTTQLQEKSLFGTATVSWDDTYFAEATLRNDWSSALPKNKNSYLYGGGSISYILSNHVKTPWLTFMKLRASAAQVGSTIEAYGALTNYSMGKYGDLTVMGQPSQYIDKFLQPTISTSYEIGTDFNLWNGLLSADINLYIRDSKNQVIDVPVSHQSGYDYIRTNAGLIRNKGFEITLNSDVINTKNFKWSLGFNISKNYNELVKISDKYKDLTSFQQNYASYGDTFIVQWSELGKSIGIIRGTDFERVNGKILFTERPANTEDERKTIDEIGKYQIGLNTSEKNFLGESQPDWLGGVSTKVSYKDFTLSATMDFQIGGKIASVTNMFGDSYGMLKSTVGKNSKGGDIRNRYADDGGIEIKGVIQEGVDQSGNPVYKDITARVGAKYYFDAKRSVWGPNVYNASYAKLREVALSYRVPKPFLNKIMKGIKDVNLSVVAVNPWLIYSSAPNIDPSDTQGGGGSGFMESANILSARSFGFTVNVTF